MRILTDLDGTLLKGSLVLGHAIYLHNKKVIDLGDLPNAWNSDKKNESLIYELAISYQNAIGVFHLDN